MTGVPPAKARPSPRTFVSRDRRNRRLNIRLSSKDLEAIQKRALAEGLPYTHRAG